MDRVANLEGLAADAQLWRIPTKGLSGLGCVIKTRHVIKARAPWQNSSRVRLLGRAQLVPRSRLSSSHGTDFVLPLASDVRRRSASKGSTAACARTGATLAAHAAMALGGRVETGPERHSAPVRTAPSEQNLAYSVQPCRCCYPTVSCQCTRHGSASSAPSTPVFQRAARLREAPSLLQRCHLVSSRPATCTRTCLIAEWTVSRVTC